MNIQEYAIPAEDRTAFAKFMAFVARADGNVSDEEKGVLEALVGAWQLDSSALAELNLVLSDGADLEQLVAELTHPKTGYLLIQELVTLANLDGSYCDAEKCAVRKIATALTISENRVAAIEQWVSDGLTWRRQGLELLSPEEV